MRFRDKVALTGDADLIWKRVSDLKWMPKYWPMIKSVDVLRAEDSETVVRFGLDAGKAEARIVETGRTLVVYYTKGPYTGTQRISILGNLLEVDWDVVFHGFRKLFSGSEGRRLRVATNQALERFVGSDDLD